MIFITLGSQKFQFNRLLIAIDKLVQDKTITDSVFAQIGYSDYKPKNFAFKDFLDRNEFAKMQDDADIIITHGGTGAIIGAVKKGKKVIAVPRLAEYGEHVDDHQIQLIEQFDGMGIIEACYNLDEFAKSYKKCESSSYKSYRSNTSAIINDINEFIKEQL